MLCSFIGKMLAKLVTFCFQVPNVYFWFPCFEKLGNGTLVS